MDATDPVPCLTYIRHPVERLVSFFYWFHARAGKEPPFLQVGALRLPGRARMLAVGWGTSVGRAQLG
jgi:hypothetical protein